MARIWGHRREVVAALVMLVAFFVAPALAQDLYDRPVLAFDPGMHTAGNWLDGGRS